ncbi:MAG: hypothetical protein KJP04_03710 [Arenicella sp.]|nr:hypothetical protein [Arenicella sp.]
MDRLTAINFCNLRSALFMTLMGSLLIATLPAASQQQGVDYSWELKRDKDNIRIYTSPVADSKYKAVRAVTTITGKVSSAVALVLDVEACPRWAELCEKSELLETLSPTESYIYTLNDLPFPVKDRDVVALVEWTVNSATGRTSMNSIATSKDLVPVGRAIRLRDAIAQWHFEQVDENTIQVESFAHIDPNGVTPAWITNMLLVDSPFKTLKKMTAIVESGQYDKTTVPFLN